MRAKNFLVVFLATVLVGGASLTAQTEDPAWDVLNETRARLVGTTWTADFVQTYVPAHFSSGDKESGKVSLALPNDVRWDYAVPFAKTFLMRVDTIYSWNAGDETGHRSTVGERDREHLDLLKLDVSPLRRRYQASTVEASPDTTAVKLVPIAPDSEIAEATVRIHSTTYHLVSLSYRDLEGNETRFELSGHRPAVDNSVFDPPNSLEWLDR